MPPKASLVISNSVIASNETEPQQHTRTDGQRKQTTDTYKKRQMEKRRRRGLQSLQIGMLGGAAASFAVVVIFLTSVAHCSSNDSEATCSRICAAENCNSVGIRYGKYCGVGWTGCPGEKPCDDVDACCKIHDECVGNKGINDVKCHEKFKTCIKKAQKSGKVGFSKQCPYETVVPTMVQGMDLAILFSQFGNSKLEL